MKPSTQYTVMALVAFSISLLSIAAATIIDNINDGPTTQPVILFLWSVLLGIVGIYFSVLGVRAYAAERREAKALAREREVESGPPSEFLTN